LFSFQKSKSFTLPSSYEIQQSGQGKLAPAMKKEEIRRPFLQKKEKKKFVTGYNRLKAVSELVETG